MDKKKIRQGDIYMCDLSVDSIDHEQGNIRPILVASANIRNDTSANVFVFPITHARKKYQPCHYPLYQNSYPFFNFKKQIVLCEEGRSVSKARLERFLGTISDEDLQGVLKTKEYVFIEK
jgi:mRNA-degrading endonuclease toxin of MazEF toxin-antitoxin module